MSTGNSIFQVDSTPGSASKKQILHGSTSSLNASPSSTDGTSCSILLSSELSMTEVDPLSNSSVVIQRPSNLETVPWSSATALFERNEQAQTDVDGYFTAHASMASVVVPENNNDGNSIDRPRNLGDSIFISIGSPTPLLSSNSDHSPTPSSTESGDVCRICHGEQSNEAPLIAPCNCSGSMKYVHQECIQTWLKSSHSLTCELCRFMYVTGRKVKPFREWKPLELTLLERWKIVCCVMIQLFAICYFVLSVEALVRAAKDFYVPQAAMWLWIKIIMSVFGISVSVACTLRQCKTFIRLFRRWEMYNRTVFVRDRVSTDVVSGGRNLIGPK